MNAKNDPMRCQRHGRDRFGNTALHNMLMQSCEISDIERLLRSKSTDVNSAGYFGYSPLQLAILGRHPLEVITALINHGADLEHRDLSGKTVLHIVIALDFTYNPITILKLLLERGAAVSSRDVRGQTALHHAVQRTRTLCIDILMKYGSSVLDQDINGRTPLHLALRGTWGCERAFELLPHGGDSLVDVQDCNGQTALHLAVTRVQRGFNSTLVTNMLDKYNGSMHMLDHNGHSPVDLAIDINIIERFAEHALKLKCVNLPLLVRYEFNFQTCNSVLEKYQKEIEIMKRIKFDKYSLYNIFSKRHDPSYLNNEEAVKGMQAAIESPDFERQFCYYSSLLRKTYKQSKQRLLLLNESLEVFDEGLPVEVRRMVLSYLDDQDLVNLLKCKQ